MSPIDQKDYKTQTFTMSNPGQVLTPEAASHMQSEIAKSGGDMSSSGAAAHAQSAAAKNANEAAKREQAREQAGGNDADNSHYASEGK